MTPGVRKKSISNIIMVAIAAAASLLTGCFDNSTPMKKVGAELNNPVMPISRAEFISLRETLIAPPFVTEALELIQEGSNIKAGMEIARLSPGERVQWLKEKQLELKKLSITVERDQKLLDIAEKSENKSIELARLAMEQRQIEYERAIEGRDWLRLLDLSETDKAGKIRLNMLQKQLEASKKMAERGFVAKQELVDNEKELSVQELNASLTKRLIDFVEKFPDEKKVFEAEEALKKARLAVEPADFSAQKNIADYQFALNESLRKFTQIASSVKELEQELKSLVIAAPDNGVLLYGETYDGSEILKLRAGAQVYPGLNFLKIVDPLNCGFSFALDQRDTITVASLTRVFFRPDAMPELLLAGTIESHVPVALEIPQAKPDGRTQVVYKASVASYPSNFKIGYSGTIYYDDFFSNSRSKFRGNRSTTVTRRPMRRTMSTIGDVKPASASFVVANFQGKLSEISEEGKTVKANEQIAAIACEELIQSARDTEIELNKKNEEYQLQLQKNSIDQEKMKKSMEVHAGALEVAKLKHAALLKSRDEDQIIELKRSLEVLQAKIALAREKILHLSELRKKGLSSELEILQSKSELANLQKDHAVTEYRLKTEESGPTRRSIKLSELDVRKAELEKEKAELDAETGDLRNSMAARLLEAEINRLTVSLGLINEQIESARIKAPTDGVIILNEYNKAGGGMGKARVGDNVYGRIPFMQVADVRNLHVHATVSEMDARFIKEGDEVQVILKGSSEKSLRGWVHSVGIIATTELSKRQDAIVQIIISMISPETGQAETDPAFRPGSTCELEFKLYDLPEALFIPFDSLLPTATATCIVTDNGTVKPVELLLSDGLRGCAVKSGLQEGDRILLMEAVDD